MLPDRERALWRVRARARERGAGEREFEVDDSDGVSGQKKKKKRQAACAHFELAEVGHFPDPIRHPGILMYIATTQVGRLGSG